MLHRKVRGPCLIALLALPALTPAAGASFDSEVDRSTVEGEQGETKHQFTVEAGTTECATAKFHSLSKMSETGPVTGTLSGGAFTSGSLTMEPIYEDCDNKCSAG